VAANGRGKPTNRPRWSGTNRRQLPHNLVEEKAVQDLPDNPGAAAGPSTNRPSAATRPESAGGSGGLSLAVQGSAVGGGGGTSSSSNSVAGHQASTMQESLSQAAIAITAQVNSPPENPSAGGAIGITKDSPARGGGFVRRITGGASNAARRQAKASPSAPRPSPHVSVEFNLERVDTESKQKVEAERERKRQMKIEKDKREREEAAKRKQERQAEKDAKAHEDAKKAKEKEVQKARQTEMEAKKKEKAALLARQQQESKRQIKKHQETVKSARPTIDKASLRRKYGTEFAARQEMLQRHDSDSVLVVPAAEPGGDTIEGRSASVSSAPERARLGSGGSTPINRSPVASKVRAADPGAAAATPPRAPCRLWTKSKNQTGSPGVEIYVPADVRLQNVSVWNDEDEDAGSEQQEVVDEVAAREEVTDGLEKLRDFNDNVKRIWDGRRGRDLLMVLDDIQGVLENDGAEEGDGPPADGNLPSPLSDLSPKMEHVTADRIEHIRANLESELSVDRLNALCRHVLRSQEEDEEDSSMQGSAARAAVRDILEPNEMHLMRQVTKLVLMEQKFYR